MEEKLEEAQVEEKLEEAQVEEKLEEAQVEEKLEEAQVEEMALVAQVELGSLGAQAVKSFRAVKWCQEGLKAEEVQLQAEDLVQREFLKHQRHVPGFGTRQPKLDINQAWDVFDTKGTGEDSTKSSRGAALGWRVQSCLGTSKKKLNIVQLWGGSLEKALKVFLREGGLLCKQVRLRQLAAFSTQHHGGAKKRSCLLLSASQMRMLLPWDPGREFQISRDPNGHDKQADMASKHMAQFLWDPGGSTEVAFRAVSSVNGHVRSTKPDGYGG
jgi:hypothetical protein